jgi:hypothetical protein
MKDRDPMPYVLVARRERRHWIACAFVLAALLCGDLIFIAISAVRDGQGLARDQWHVSVDGGIAEHWQYAKWAALTLLLGSLTLRRRSLVFFAWAALFLYLLVDDSQMIHERLGLWLATTLGLRPAIGLRPEDFGELLVTAGAAAPLFGLLAFAYVRTADAEARGFTRQMLVLVVALAAFGIGADMLDVMTVPWRTVSRTLELVEDGGEMLVASAMTVYALHAAVQLGPSQAARRRVRTEQRGRDD